MALNGGGAAFVFSCGVLGVCFPFEVAAVLVAGEARMAAEDDPFPPGTCTIVVAESI
jgi:hypothetical protein